MKKLAFAILSLCLIGSSVGCSNSSKSKKDDKQETAESQPAEKPEKTAQEWFVQANDRMDSGNYAAAASMYDKALAQDQTRTDIYINKAIAQSFDGDFEASVQTLETAITNGGKEDPVVYYTLGNVYHKRGMYGYAARAYRNSLAYGDDENVDTLINLASSYLLMKEFEKAEETYDFIQKLVPDDPRPYVGLGMANHAQQNYERALELYDKALAADPDYAQGWYNRADVLEDLENWNEAIKSYERYLDLDPSKRDAKRARKAIELLQRKR